MALNIESKNISIYPTAYRQYKDGDNVTQAVDFTSRLNTEFNMTKNLKALSSLNDGSFVIGYDTTGQSHIIEFYLKGYFFQIRDFVPEANKELYVSLTTKNFSDSNYKNLIEVVPFDTDPAIDTDRDLDDLNSTDNKVYFNGLGFSNAGGDLKLLNSDGSVPKESYWKYQFKDIKTDLTEDLEITNTQKTKFKNGNNEIEIDNKPTTKGIKILSNGNYLHFDEINNEVELYGNKIKLNTGVGNVIILNDDYYDMFIQANGTGMEIYGTRMYLLDCEINIEADSLVIESYSGIEVNSDTEFSNDVDIDEDLKVYGSATISGDVSFKDDKFRVYSDSTYAYRMLINFGNTFIDYNTRDGLSLDINGKNIYFTNGQQVRYALVGGQTTYIYGSNTTLTNADDKFIISGSPVGNSNKVKMIIDPEEGEIINDDYYTGDILIQRNGETPISLFGLNTRTTNLENKHIYTHNVRLIYIYSGSEYHYYEVRFVITNNNNIPLTYTDIKNYVFSVNYIPATGYVNDKDSEASSNNNYGWVYGLSKFGNYLVINVVTRLNYTASASIDSSRISSIDDNIVQLL